MVQKKIKQILFGHQVMILPPVTVGDNIRMVGIMNLKTSRISY